jgi:hypothetical protein
VAHDPGARLIGNVTAMGVLLVAQRLVTCCPQCGAEPWVNINRKLCDIVSTALRFEEIK